MEQPTRQECMVVELQEEVHHKIMVMVDKEELQLLEALDIRAVLVHQVHLEKVDKDIIVQVDMEALEEADGTVVLEVIQIVLEMMTVEAVEDLDMYIHLQQHQIILQAAY